MAYTQAKFIRDLAIFSAGGILGPTRTRQLLAYAGRKGIQLAGFGATRAAPAIGAAALAHPVVAGTALGLGTLATPPGEALLAAAEEHGRQSRILFERAQQELITAPQRAFMGIEAAAPVSIAQALPEVVPRIRKRGASAFNRAVSAGMKAVKTSTSYGKKGTIKPAKKAFALVTKLAAAKKKKKKAPKSGIRRRIWNAMKGLR